jgi:flagellar motor switch protein FliG
MNERATKAAIILLALGGSLGSRLIKEFKPDEIRQFAASAATLDDIDPAILGELVDEFSSEMDKPALLRGGGDQARAYLAEAFPADQIDSMLGVEESAFAPIWQNFAAGSENALVPYLLDEHPQTVAFVLTKLDLDLSAQVLALLPQKSRDSVTRRLLKMQAVAFEPGKLVQLSMQADLLSLADTGLEDEGRARMATLLNKMDKGQVDAILESLKSGRPGEAAALKRLLFSFEDILKLEQKHRLILFDKVQTEQVMLALRGVDGELKEIVLSSLGARARRMIESELNGPDAQVEVTKEVAAARRSITETALRLSASGEISIVEADADSPARDAA